MSVPKGGGFSVFGVEVDGVVVAAHPVAGSAVEGNRLRRFLVDQQRDRPCPGEKVTAELRQTAQPIAPPALLRGHPDALDVDDLGSVRDDVGLEDETAILYPH